MSQTPECPVDPPSILIFDPAADDPPDLTAFFRHARAHGCLVTVQIGPSVHQPVQRICAMKTVRVLIGSECRKVNDSRYRTTDEWAADLGAQLRALRLELDLDQPGLATRANVSLSVVRALEAGRVFSLRTVIRVARAFGRTEWLCSFHHFLDFSRWHYVERAMACGHRGGVAAPPPPRGRVETDDQLQAEEDRQAIQED